MVEAAPAIKSLLGSPRFGAILDEAGYSINIPELEQFFAETGTPVKITRVHDEIIVEEVDPLTNTTEIGGEG